MDVNILAVLFGGLSLSSILLLLAFGLALIFGMMNVINMAHGEFITWGGYTAFLVNGLFGQLFTGAARELWFVVAIFASFLLTAIMGAIIERLIVRHLYGRIIDTLLVTWGIGIVLRQLIRTIFTGVSVPTEIPQWLRGGYSLTANFTLPYTRLFIIGIAVLVVIGVYYLFYRTRIGRLTRAVLQDRDMAAASGVPIARLDMFAFSLGAGLAGLAGCALTLLGSLNPMTGFHYLVDSFLVVIAGGVGRLVGTISASGAVGFTEYFLQVITGPIMGRALVFVLIILFLQFRPKGMLPLSGRRR